MLIALAPIFLRGEHLMIHVWVGAVLHGPIMALIKLRSRE